MRSGSHERFEYIFQNLVVIPTGVDGLDASGNHCKMLQSQFLTQPTNRTSFLALSVCSVVSVKSLFERNSPVTSDCRFALQVKYNVLDTSPEANGLLRKCQELGVTLVAHTPLQQGILTGMHLNPDDLQISCLSPVHVTELETEKMCNDAIWHKRWEDRPLACLLLCLRVSVNAISIVDQCHCCTIQQTSYNHCQPTNTSFGMLAICCIAAVSCTRSKATGLKVLRHGTRLYDSWHDYHCLPLPDSSTALINVHTRSRTSPTTQMQLHYSLVSAGSCKHVLQDPDAVSTDTTCSYCKAAEPVSL